MPQYRLLAKSFMAKTPGAPVEILRAGTIIEYDGSPGSNLDPLDDEAKARKPAPRYSTAALNIYKPADWKDQRK